MFFLQLLPVLLQGITCNEEAVTESTLTSLASLLQQSVEHAGPHISTLIPTLLSLTANRPLVKSPPPKNLPDMFLIMYFSF